MSAAIGDLPNLPGTAALAALGAAHSGAAYVKVGLWGTSTEDEAVAVLRAVHEALDGGPTVIAAAYADAERVPSRPLAPGAVVAAARRAGVGRLPGRHRRQGRSRALRMARARRAHGVGRRGARRQPRDGAGRRVARRGPSAVRATGADIAGVRSAACRDGRRTAPLDAERIGRLRALCARSAY